MPDYCTWKTEVYGIQNQRYQAFACTTWADCTDHHEIGHPKRRRHGHRHHYSRCCYTGSSILARNLFTHENGKTFHVQDQTRMEEHLLSFAGVCSDITDPLTESSCGGRYLVHFTCASTKWSRANDIAKKNDVVDLFKGLFWYG